MELGHWASAPTEGRPAGHARSHPGWALAGRGRMRAACDSVPPQAAGLPIVASSASVDEATRRRAEDAGCDEFLPKPVRLSALFAMVARRLGLAWIRAPRVVAEAVEEPAPRVAPPPEVLARLSDLAERGRIPELLQQLQVLEAEDARLGAWVSGVRALAEGYRLRELRDELAKGD